LSQSTGITPAKDAEPEPKRFATGNGDVNEVSLGIFFPEGVIADVAARLRFDDMI
jgi:hypothetical protein